MEMNEKAEHKTGTKLQQNVFSLLVRKKNDKKAKLTGPPICVEPVVAELNVCERGAKPYPGFIICRNELTTEHFVKLYDCFSVDVCLMFGYKE